MEGTPHLLTDVKFSERRKGYDPVEVDNFLERVSSAVAQLQDKLRDATAQAEGVDARINEAKRAQTVAEAQVDQLKAELQKVGGGTATPRSAVDPVDDAAAASTLLVMAKKTADATIEDARTEAETTVTDARSRAATLVADAETEAARVRSDAERIAKDLVQEQQAAVRAEVVALEEMKGSIQADIELLQRHVERERADLRAAVGRLSEVIDNPAALRVSESPVGPTPGIEAALAPAAGVEAIDEVDDPDASEVESVEAESVVDESPEPESESDSESPHREDDASDAVEGTDDADDGSSEVDSSESESEDEAEDDDDEAEADDGGLAAKLFADEPEIRVDTGPPTEAFKPFAEDAAKDDKDDFDAPRDADEDKAMRAFFETDFESMEADKRSRWRR